MSLGATSDNERQMIQLILQAQTPALLSMKTLKGFGHNKFAVSRLNRKEIADVLIKNLAYRGRDVKQNWTGYPDNLWKILLKDAKVNKPLFIPQLTLGSDKAIRKVWLSLRKGLEW